MNEAERTDVQILLRHVMDYVRFAEGNPDAIYPEDSDDLREAVQRVLAHIYTDVRPSSAADIRPEGFKPDGTYRKAVRTLSEVRA